MKKLLLDVNVVLDVLLNREPHAAMGTAVWAAVRSGLAKGVLAGHGLTTVYYLIQKAKGSDEARKAIAEILDVFGIASIDLHVVQNALQLNSPDFEDAVTACAAAEAGCDAIVTRDPRGFRTSPVRAITPQAAVAALGRP
jgi:predicted nucleic acid-binding protein